MLRALPSSCIHLLSVSFRLVNIFQPPLQHHCFPFLHLPELKDLETPMFSSWVPPRGMPKLACTDLGEHLPPAPLSVTWGHKLEIGLVWSIYTTGISKPYESELSPTEPVVKYLPAYHWSHLTCLSTKTY